MYDLLLNAKSAIHTLLSDIDWRRSPLGKPAAWPGPLRTVLALMLNSNNAMFLVTPVYIGRGLVGGALCVLTVI